MKHISKSNTVFIVDWDDTLFPSTWFISKQKIETEQLLIKLDKYIEKLLNKMIKMGQVIIISNATLQWIQISSSMLPNASKIIKNLKIISTRDKYKTKTKAFNDIIGTKIKFGYVNIISMGDAEYEYDALIQLNKIPKEKYLKAIKFAKIPNYSNVVYQLKSLIENIDNIAIIKNNLDLFFRFE